MRYSLLLITFIQLSSFGFAQMKNEQIKQLQKKIHLQNEKIDSLKLIIDDWIMASVEPIQEKSPLINWLNENFGMIVPSEMSLMCEFNCSNYTGKLNESILKEFQEEYWLGTFHLNDIKSTENGIVIDLGTDDLSKIMIITENYFTVSYHGIVGSDGQTLIYSFEKKATTIDHDNFCYNFMSPTVLQAARDYYDSKDVEDPNYRGHIFEYGAYNLETQQYTFITFE